MKRSVLILSLAAFVLSSNAQVLKSNLLNGYKQGDKLEKATYNKADAPIKIDTWCEAFSSQTDKNAGSPIRVSWRWPGQWHTGDRLAAAGSCRCRWSCARPRRSAQSVRQRWGLAA